MLASQVTARYNTLCRIAYTLYFFSLIIEIILSANINIQYIIHSKYSVIKIAVYFDNQKNLACIKYIIIEFRKNYKL